MKNPVQGRIDREISKHDVVLFMKGTPVFPQCGFSAVVIQLLSHLGVKFTGIGVLSDPALRQGIKALSDWPTVPQLYVKGEFIGGCDIVREMLETGELEVVLAADSCYFCRTLRERRLPPRAHNHEAMLASLDRLAALEAGGARIFYRHDRSSGRPCRRRQCRSDERLISNPSGLRRVLDA